MRSPTDGPPSANAWVGAKNVHSDGGERRSIALQGIVAYIMILVFERTTWNKYLNVLTSITGLNPRPLGCPGSGASAVASSWGSNSCCSRCCCCRRGCCFCSCCCPCSGCWCCCCPVAVAAVAAAAYGHIFWALPLAAWLFRAWAAVYRHQFFLVLESSKWHWGRMSVECTCKYVLAFSLACVRVHCIRSRQRRRRWGVHKIGEGLAPLLKSRDPHMAGEEKSYKFTMLIKDWRIYHQKQWTPIYSWVNQLFLWPFSIENC